MQPDSLIPDPSNPQAWNRYSYVANNPVNFNDPTGHKYNPCKGAASGYKCHRELDRQKRDEQIRQDKIVKDFGFNNLLDFQRWAKDNKIQNPDMLLDLQIGNSSGAGEDEGGANWLLDRYMLGWKNAGQAWTIVSNSNESFVRRLGASAYLTGWVGFGHIGLALGLSGLGCAALIAGCGTAVGTGGPILIQGFARGGSGQTHLNW